jgi:hypothetical protein
MAVLLAPTADGEKEPGKRRVQIVYDGPAS